MTFPPGPPANRKPGTSVGSPNRHFLINGLWPWVTCQVQGQLNMFTTCNGKNKSFAWILGTRQMANHIHGTEIKVTGSILPRAGNGVACSVNRSWLFFAMSAATLKMVFVLVPTCLVSMALGPALQCRVSVVWRDFRRVCYTCEYARQMLAGSQADSLSSPWPFWLWLWHGDTQ